MRGMRISIIGAALLLGGCASDAALQADSLANRRPECLVGGDPISAARDSGMSARERDCGTDRSLHWSSERSGNAPMKVDFGKAND